MNKNIVIIAGQTGVGKSKLANEIARKINGEIILIDSIQQFKHMNIIANKPSKFLQQVVKYHNISEYDFSIGTMNTMFHAEKIRSKISEIWDKGKIPVLEGGCGFYYKAILTGGETRMSKLEEKEYSKYILVAREIIKIDNKFETTFNRLIRMDKSLPELLPIKNDLYRLERRIADAMMYGDGAFKLLRDRESNLKSNNSFFNDTAMYNFFVYCDKLILNKKLEERTEKMFKNGIIKEVSDLLSNNIITPIMFNSNSDSNSTYSSVFTNAYGLIETIEYLNKIIELDKKENFIEAYGGNISKRDEIANKYKKIILKILYDLLDKITIRSRQYGKRQATWFKKQENFLWIDGEEINNNNSNFSDIIIEKYLNKPIEEFNKQINSEENEEIKRKYNFKEIKTSIGGNYQILRSNNKIRDIISDSFKYSQINKDKLIEIEKYIKNKKRSNIDLEKDKNRDENDIDSISDIKVDKEILENYLKL